MKLGNQVVSLELAKKLKELGVKQESCFQWLKITDGGIPQSGGFLSLWVNDRRYFVNELFNKTSFFKIEQQIDITEEFSAFTVAELGEMLPPNSKTSKWLDTNWWAENERLLNNNAIPADTEADARAKMLIYLLENKLL